MTLLISSLHNPRIKTLVTLRERRHRQSAGLILVEGAEELSLALESGAQMHEVYFCPALLRDLRLLERLSVHGATLVEVTDRVFEKIAYRENPDGWLATVRWARRGLGDLRLSANPFLVVAESVEKPGNLGAILRTADAAGVEGLIACDPRTDWGNPNVVRASKGALFAVPVADAEGHATRLWLRERSIRTVVATPAATQVYTALDLRGPLALVVGEEKHGLSDRWIAEADEAVLIPMFGRVNSLNVATAAALLIYEVVRQRSAR